MARGQQLNRTLLLINKLYTSRYGVNIGELAEEFNTSQKTIRRDLNVLEASFLPLTEEKREGKKYFKLMPGYLQEFDVPFQPAELMALYFFKDFLAPLEGTGFEDQFRMLVNKIENGIPEGAKAFCNKLQKSFRTRISHKPNYKDMKLIIEQLNKAVCERKAISILYYSYSSKRTAKRKVHPYCLYYYQGSIYLVGKDFLSKERRTFNIERIRKINVLKDTFKLPDDFDAENYFNNSFGIFKEKEATTVVLEFSSSVSPFIQERIWHPSQKIEELPQGKIRLTMQVEGLKELKSWVMGFTHHVEVMEPETLRQEIKKDVEAMQKIYR